VGVEAALEALERGWEVAVYEAGREVGWALESWAHVELLTPWGMLRGPRGSRLLREAGRHMAPDDAALTGGDLLEAYLRPLAGLPPLEGRIRTGMRVLGLARRSLRKIDAGGRRARVGKPFLIHLQSASGRESHEEADAVLDCTGVQRQPNPLGPGGGCAAGETALQAAGERSGVMRRIPDLAGRDRKTFAGRRVMLLGAGHSAATALLGLEALTREAPATRVTWVWRGSGAPYRPDPADPLPRRRAIERRAAALAADPPDWLDVKPGHEVEALHVEGGGLAARMAGRVVLRGPGGTVGVGTDILLALVGYRPDVGIFRELRVRTSRATEGIPALSRAREAGSAGEALATTEPGYLILGQKAYGRAAGFLLRDGYRHVGMAFDLLDRQMPSARQAGPGGPA
jgi:hypothetical protein